MSYFTLKRSSTAALTRQFLADFRTLEPSPTERDLTPTRVKHLHGKVEHGLLVPFIWATATLNGKTYRMNGQHSSAMLEALGDALPSGLMAHLDEYEVESKEGLAWLFRQFDDRKSGRTPVDVAGAFQGVVDPIREVAKPAVKIGIEGVNWYERYVAGTPTLVGDEVYSKLTRATYHPFLKWLGSVFPDVSPDPYGEFKKVPVMAAIYATYIGAGKDAQNFWEAATQGDLSNINQAYRLQRWLLAIKEPAKEAKRRIKPGNLYQGSIYAWRAYHYGKAITDVRCDIKKGADFLPVLDEDDDTPRGRDPVSPVNSLDEMNARIQARNREPADLHA